jgi:hypothetical protein
MIRRFGIGCALVAALALPAGAAAKSSPGEVKNAAKHCKSLRAEMGRDAFRAEFGRNKNGRNAFGKCVSRNAKREHRAARRALRECKAEFAKDPAAFLEKYLSEDAEASFERPGEEGERPAPPKPEGDAPEESRPEKSRPEKSRLAAALRRAMHRCVKLKLRALKTERREALETAVEECRAEFVADPAAFVEKYGPDVPKLAKLLAFGRCVLSKVNTSS